MNQYLLDTNVASELRKARPHGAVMAWLSAAEEESLFVSAVTLGELQVGIERIRRQDPSKAGQLEHWVDRVPLFTGCFQGIQPAFGNGAELWIRNPLNFCKAH